MSEENQIYESLNDLAVSSLTKFCLKKALQDQKAGLSSQDIRLDNCLSRVFAVFGKISPIIFKPIPLEEDAPAEAEGEEE
jgi:hypothetical protein